MTDKALPASADIAIIGAGIIGAAAASELARRGANAAVFDLHAPPHDRGGSHGETRMIRQSYAEGAVYVPLARRACALWRDLNARTGETIYNECGVFYAGPEDGQLLAGVRASADAYGLPLQDGDAAPGHERFDLAPGHGAVFEPEAGYVLAEGAVSAFLDEARRHGVRVFTGTPVTGLERAGAGYVLRTSAGLVSARRVILAAGGWTGALAPALKPLLHLQRRVLCWFAAPGGAFAPGRFSPFAVEEPQGWFYGFPDALGTGVKIGVHQGDEPFAHPDDMARAIRPDDGRDIDAAAVSRLPGLGARRHAAACFYTMSPDEDFIISLGGLEPDMAVVTGLSGHGFKFAPAIGEALAGWALGTPVRTDLAPFSPGRFR